MPVEDCKPYGEESTVPRSIDYRTAHLIRSAQYFETAPEQLCGCPCLFSVHPALVPLGRLATLTLDVSVQSNKLHQRPRAPLQIRCESSRNSNQPAS